MNEKIAKEIRYYYSVDAFNQRELAKKYNLSLGTINNIINNKIFVDDRYINNHKRKEYQEAKKDELILSIRRDYATGKYTQRELSKKYDVALHTINTIIKYNKWR